jgi:selenocysteine lyase/cysteine desulfurase
VITILIEPRGGWEGVQKRMEIEGVRLSWRKEHGGRMLLRVSPHASNTVAEIEKFHSLLGTAD